MNGGVVQQIRAGAGPGDTAGGHHVATMGETERHAGILLD